MAHGAESLLSLSHLDDMRAGEAPGNQRRNYRNSLFGYRAWRLERGLGERDQSVTVFEPRLCDMQPSSALLGNTAGGPKVNQSCPKRLVRKQSTHGNENDGDATSPCGFP